MKKCSSMQIDVWGQAVKVSFTACPRFSVSACQFYACQTSIHRASQLAR